MIVRQLPIYAMMAPLLKPTIRQIPMYAMMTALKDLPLGVEGKENLLRAILTATKEPLSPSDVVLGLPETSTEYGCNTRVILTSNTRQYTGEMHLFYNRANVNRLPLPGSFRLQSEQSVYGVLERLKVATGMALQESDFVNSSVVAGKVSLTGGQNSYFFVPGSQIQLTT